MLREAFMGKNPSHFHVNPFVKAFIYAEIFIFSGWNFIIPIFALFVINTPGGNIEIAASSFSIFLVVRVVGELLSGRMLLNSPEINKFLLTILGIFILGLAYLGFAFTSTLHHIFIFYGLAGLGLGIATPAKNSLFSVHLDKNKETLEWGILDALTALCMALAGALGGFIAYRYGFQVLFFICFFVNLLAIVPYVLYMRQHKVLLRHRS